MRMKYCSFPHPSPLILAVLAAGCALTARGEYVAYYKRMLPMPEGVTQASPSAINNQGQIAGVSGVTSLAWLNMASMEAPVYPFGLQSCMAMDINDDAVVVGWNLNFNQATAAFYAEDGWQTTLLPWGGNSLAEAVNNIGMAVGYSYGVQDTALYGSVAGGAPVTMSGTVPGLGEITLSRATVINDNNTVGGMYNDSAYLWRPGMGLEYAGDFSITGLNNDDTLVGTNFESDTCFIYDGTLTTIAGFYPIAINNDGRIAGQHGTWHPDTGYVPYADILPADQTIADVADMDDMGNLVGTTGTGQPFLATVQARLYGADVETFRFSPTGNIEEAMFTGGKTAEGVGYTLEIDATRTDEYSLLVVAVPVEMWDQVVDMRLGYFSAGDGEWIPAGDPSSFFFDNPMGHNNTGDWGVDEEGRYVWANVDHFSTYGVFVIPEPGTMSFWLVVGALAGLRRLRAAAR